MNEKNGTSRSPTHIRLPPHIRYYPWNDYDLENDYDLDDYPIHYRTVNSPKYNLVLLKPEKEISDSKIKTEIKSPVREDFPKLNDPIVVHTNTSDDLKEELVTILSFLDEIHDQHDNVSDNLNEVIETVCVMNYLITENQSTPVNIASNNKTYEYVISPVEPDEVLVDHQFTQTESKRLKTEELKDNKEEKEKLEDDKISESIVSESTVSESTVNTASNNKTHEYVISPVEPDKALVDQQFTQTESKRLKTEELKDNKEEKEKLEDDKISESIVSESTVSSNVSEKNEILRLFSLYDLPSPCGNRDIP
ncbi:hypothetical protein ALC57_08089 [Trachymyrmex cornetzi]|uniref:Uncharacterized protein n=1 Tax=Trachymyrmex cornetzi TaxID=471704 RepID=A0A195E389_9HYME|nr:hypothetical protein ALC57_08089 [Trachymyrmex cornetzi]